MGQIYRYEIDSPGRTAIVYDDPIETKDRIRIKVCYDPKEQGAHSDALRKFWDGYDRMRTNQRLTNIK